MNTSSNTTNPATVRGCEYFGLLFDHTAISLGLSSIWIGPFYAFTLWAWLTSYFWGASHSTIFVSCHVLQGGGVWVCALSIMREVPFLILRRLLFTRPFAIFLFKFSGNLPTQWGIKMRVGVRKTRSCPRSCRESRRNSNWSMQRFWSWSRGRSSCRRREHWWVGNKIISEFQHLAKNLKS